MTRPNETRAERRARGEKAFAEIDSKGSAGLVSSLSAIAPEMANLLLEHAFGDVLSRPGLDWRSREIATIAALTAMGTATPQLKVHIAAGLHVGLTRQEIIEIMLQMSVYAGYPAGLNGLVAAKEVFAADDQPE